MSVANIIQSVTNRGREADQAVHDLAVEIIEGEAIPEESTVEACRNAGMSLAAFAAILERLQARKDAVEEWKSRDFDAEIAEATKKYRDAAANKEAVAKEQEALRVEFKRLVDQMSSLGRVPSRLREERDAARKKLNDALAPNTRDWRIL